MSYIKTEYKYTVDESDTYADSYFLYRYDWQTAKYDLDDEFDLQYLAEVCAEDFHSNHDGWDYSAWNNGRDSMPFFIWTSETTKVRFDVSVEYEPRFHAHKKEL